LYTNTIENFEILNCKFRQVISMALNDKIEQTTEGALRNGISVTKI